MSAIPSATLVPPSSSTSQATENQATSFFTKEKITRLALRILSALALLGAIVAGANVIAGTMSAWHALTSLYLFSEYKRFWADADHTFDLNDSQERQSAIHYLSGRTFPLMLELYPVETILQYDLVPLDILRRYCCSELRYAARYRSFIPPILSAKADQLLQHRIITPEMHQMIVRNDLPALAELPDSTGIIEIFRTYDTP